MKITFSVFVVLLAVGLHSFAQQKKQSGFSTYSLEKLKLYISQHPDNLTAHQAYLLQLRAKPEQAEQQYKQWMHDFPRLATIPFAIGKDFFNQERPEARTYLLKAIKADSTLAQAYYMLAIDAKTRQDSAAYILWLDKAAQADTHNPDIAFSSAYRYIHVDTHKALPRFYEIERRFPNTEQARAALGAFARYTPDTLTRIQRLETLKRLYSPLKFGYSSYTMKQLYYLYLDTNPQKAVALAGELHWQAKKIFALHMLAINKRIVQKDYAGALAEIHATKNINTMPKMPTEYPYWRRE